MADQSSIQRQYFEFEVSQTALPPPTEEPASSSRLRFPSKIQQLFKPKKLRIEFQLFKVTGWINNNNNPPPSLSAVDDENDISFEEPRLVDELRGWEVSYRASKLSSRRSDFKRSLSRVLTERMSHVPTENVPAVMEKVCQVVDQPVHASSSILVVMKKVTLRSRPQPVDDSDCDEYGYESEDEDDIDAIDGQILDQMLQESMETHELQLTPASKSSIRRLKRVGIDALEAAAVEKKTRCVICLEGFSDEAGDGEGTISRLPCCANFYHTDCIVEWLETSHLCPLCRSPMPMVEEEAASCWTYFRSVEGNLRRLVVTTLESITGQAERAREGGEILNQHH